MNDKDFITKILNRENTSLSDLSNGLCSSEKTNITYVKEKQVKNKSRIEEVIWQIKIICNANNLEIDKIKSVLNLNKITNCYNRQYGQAIGTVSEIYLRQQMHFLQQENKNHDKVIGLLMQILQEEERK